MRKKQLQLLVPPSMRERVERLSAVYRMRMSEIGRRALEGGGIGALEKARNVPPVPDAKLLDQGDKVSLPMAVHPDVDAVVERLARIHDMEKAPFWRAALTHGLKAVQDDPGLAWRGTSADKQEKPAEPVTA